MGALLEWLHLECDGNKVTHDSKWTEAHLRFEDRLQKREHFFELGILPLLFDAERDPWPLEVAESDYAEPRRLP